MIIIFLGGVGSGKTLSAVREIRRRNQFALTNFKLKNIKEYHRLKYENIIIPAEKKSDYSVNWKFWEKVRKSHKYFSIYLDEIHNIMDARASTSVDNRILSRWLSQIRKMTSDNEYNNLVAISQKIRRIDVNLRELAHLFVECRKIEIGDKVYIWQDYFDGIDNYEKDRHAAQIYFKAEPYYKYFDTKEMVQFGDVEEYL